jgi:hypothetical protein
LSPQQCETMNKNTFVFVAHIDGMVEAVIVFDASRCMPWHRMYDGRMGCGVIRGCVLF